MHLDRRSLVKFIAGGLVGLSASPLIPKLMDDSAIWTQNWSWVPNLEDGALAFANTVNPATGTGLRVRLIKSRIVGERIIRVEGNPDHPLSQGGVLPADISMLQLLYNDEIRVSSPLVYDKKTGIYQETSWDKALEIVSSKLIELAKTDNAHTVVAFGDNSDSIHGQILSSFMTAYGSPNLVFQPRPNDVLALAGWALTGQRDIGFDLANASYIISFGTPLLEAFGSSVAIHNFFGEWKKNKSTLVQVESRCSVTASSSDIFLPCNPGTESIVALGMAAVIVEQGFVDESAITAYGFPEFKAVLMKDYNLKKAAEISGVSAGKITAVAKAFAKNPKALAVCGPGPGGDPGRLADFIAVMALNGLRGNLGKPGGIVIRKSFGLKNLNELSSVNKPSLVTYKKGIKDIDAISMAKAALCGHPYKVNMLLVADANPAYVGPQAGLMNEFIDSVPFVVAITPFLNETAVKADVVLPSATFLESWIDCRTPYGSPVSAYGLAKPLVKPYTQAKTVGDIFLALAAKLGSKLSLALPFASVEEVLKTQVAPIGELFDLAKRSFFIQEKPIYGPFIFKTPSGRLEFQSQNLATFIGNFFDHDILLPHWEKPIAFANYSEGHTLIMAAIPCLRSAVGSQPLTPYMLKLQDDNMLRYKDELVIEINPKTAATLGLVEDSKITVSSAVGSVDARVHLYAGAAPGMIFMPTGLGHSMVNDAYTFKRGGNFYRIAEAIIDPLTGIPSWGLTRVTVSKIRV